MDSKQRQIVDSLAKRALCAVVSEVRTVTSEVDVYAPTSLTKAQALSTVRRIESLIAYAREQLVYLADDVPEEPGEARAAPVVRLAEVAP